MELSLELDDTTGKVDLAVLVSDFEDDFDCMDEADSSTEISVLVGYL